VAVRPETDDAYPVGVSPLWWLGKKTLGQGRRSRPDRSSSGSVTDEVSRRPSGQAAVLATRWKLVPTLLWMNASGNR
jgi:hypothetical protein